MPTPKNRFKFLKKMPFQAVGIILMLLVAIALLWIGNANSNEAVLATSAQVYFEGEYRIGNGQWQNVIAGQHIPATKGDVTLRGSFHMLTPDGEYIGPLEANIPIALYMDHINVTVYEGDNEPFVHDTENPLFGASTCGEMWLAHSFTSDGAEPIELVIHNPHHFGNETAVDEMLSNVAIWGNIDFEKEILSMGEEQRNVGSFFIIISLVMLGTALFSTLIHTKYSKIIWLLGLTIIFAGTYFIYSSDGISLWNDSVVSNTILLESSVILYFLFLSSSVSYVLKATKQIGIITTTVLGAIDTVLFALPIMTEIFFYDVLPFWVLVQTVANMVLIVCLVKEFVSTKEKDRWLYLGTLLPMVAFELDAIMTMLGHWKGGLVSKYVFVGLFIVAMIMVLKVIPQNFNASAKAKELETEKMSLNVQLAENRISTMMSQIRPHFIYNTLGSIEQLCELNPPKAAELVHNFAKYLRGNFGELDNTKPIRMSQEMEHVRHYISIESVRFPDMTFTFELKSEDFSLPELTIQPIVENAIKHGLMKLQKGGSIRVISYETDTDYCVSVEDDGVGFDTSKLFDEKKHIGIRNIRDRLEVMVGGTLEIESTQGVGTKVLITIPKEGER